MVAIARGLLILMGALGWLTTVGFTQAGAGAKPRPLVLVVMDPLAAPLSCPCVKGYAQRDYAKLGEYLQEKLAREILIKFSESLDKALVDVEGGRADLIIGKHSVVLADAQRLGHKVNPVAALTGKDGSTTQRGLILVRTEDPAQTLADLQAYRVILGPAECDEKNSAARALFARQGILLPVDCPISAACSDGAAEVVETGAKIKVATVISSYAHKLLEGCGTIQKGDLRVVGKTAPVPFITAFTTERVAEKDRDAIRDELLNLIETPKLCEALETQLGFVELPDTGTVTAKKK